MLNSVLGEIRLFGSRNPSIITGKQKWILCDGHVEPPGKYPILRQLQGNPNRQNISDAVPRFIGIDAWSPYYDKQTGDTRSQADGSINYSIATNNKIDGDRKWVYVAHTNIYYGNELAEPTVIPAPTTLETVIYSADDDHWYFTGYNNGTTYKSPDSDISNISLVTDQTIERSVRATATDGAGTFIKSWTSTPRNEIEVSTDHCETWTTITLPNSSASFLVEAVLYNSTHDMWVCQQYQHLFWTDPGSDPSVLGNWNEKGIDNETPRAVAMNSTDGITYLAATTSNNLRKYEYDSGGNTWSDSIIVLSLTNMHSMRHIRGAEFMVASVNGVIHHTNDNGSTWNQLETNFVDDSISIYKIEIDATGLVVALGDTVANICYLPNRKYVPVPKMEHPLGAGYYIRVV